MQAVQTVDRPVQFRQEESQLEHPRVVILEYIPVVVEQSSIQFPWYKKPVKQLRQNVALVQVKHLPTQIEQTYDPVSG